MKKSNTKRKRVKGAEERTVVEFFVKHGQCSLPMVELIEQSSLAVDELIDVVGRNAVEAVLQLSAQQLTGAKSQGKQTNRANGVRWYGRKWGAVALSDRKLSVLRPRLRDQAGADDDFVVERGFDAQLREVAAGDGRHGGREEVEREPGVH